VDPGGVIVAVLDLQCLAVKRLGVPVLALMVVSAGHDQSWSSKCFDARNFAGIPFFARYF
jgi:hypothetical protein